jgi:hypothetical protein
VESQAVDGGNRLLLGSLFNRSPEVGRWHRRKARLE